MPSRKSSLPDSELYDVKAKGAAMRHESITKKNCSLNYSQQNWAAENENTTIVSADIIDIYFMKKQKLM